MLIVFTPNIPDALSYKYLNEWMKDYDFCHLKITFQSQNKIEELSRHIKKIISFNPLYEHKLVVHINEAIIQNNISILNELLKKLHFEYNISRFHFSEKLLELLFHQKELKIFHHYNISASLHHLNIKEIHNHLSYIIYGPVFTSISKQNYFPEKNIDELKNDLSAISESTEIPVIAIGGITSENFHIPFDIGFSGVALRGYLWENTNPDKQFKKFIHQWKTFKNQ